MYSLVRQGGSVLIGNHSQDPKVAHPRRRRDDIYQWITESEDLVEMTGVVPRR